MRRTRGYGALLTVVLAGFGCGGEGLDIEPLALAPVVGTPQSADPALAVAESGDLVLSWVGGDERAWSLLVARSADGGRSWSVPARVAGGPDAPDEVHPHGESSPRLVPGPGPQLALVWPNSVRVEGRRWPATMLRFARSSDGGATWSPPITLNDDTTGSPVSHQFHGAAWQGDSGLVVAWLDERHAEEAMAAAGGAPIGGEPDATIYAAASPDFGRTWGSNTRLWGTACPCCRISLTRGDGGGVTAAWRQHFPGSVRDVVVAPVRPDATPVRVHADGWVYPGCPHSGPAAAGAHGGAVHTAWYSGKPGASGVFYRRVGGRAGSAGALLPLFTAEQVPTAHPAVAPLRDGGALVAYDVGPGARRVIRLARISASGARVAEATVPGSEGGGYPQLAALPDGGAVVAYTATAGDTRSVRAAVVRSLTAR